MQNCCALTVLVFIDKRIPGANVIVFSRSFFGFKTDIVKALNKIIAFSLLNSWYLSITDDK